VNDYYQAFGIGRKLALDPKDLETRFYALSRKLHPDLFARKSKAERDKAEDDTAVLNDAYRTLRDPIARAEYLLKQEGFDIGEQGTKDVPPELLEEVFELNMALEDADTEQIAAFRKRFEEMRTKLDGEMQGAFTQWDSAQSRDALAAVRGLLNRRKYITNLINQTHVPDRI
jgi:molecular chaperone HscB